MAFHLGEIFAMLCTTYRVNSKPGRQFTRDRQQYRRKNRGFEKKRRPGRKPKSKAAMRPEQFSLEIKKE